MIKYRSGLESRISKQLLDCGVEFEYEDTIIEFKEPEKIRKYKPDFRVGDKYYEVKGYWRYDDRMKIKWVLEQHPNLDLTIVFQRDLRIRKGSKTKYSDWCEKMGIKYMMVEEFINLVRLNRI